MEKSYKRIYDPLHGFIGLTRLEAEILDTCVVQRLRRVRQLGPAEYVYPSATHTRLAHSLGTLYLAGRIAGKAGLEGEDVEAVRLSALLHDVGHMPFSHAVEPVPHEETGLEVIRLYLSEALGEYSRRVADILLGMDDLSPIVSSEVDADRLDYLARDSYFTGLRYGMVDVEQIVDSMVLVEHGGRRVLALPEDAMAAFESLLIGRYHMFLRLYCHRTVGGFEALLSRFYAVAVREGLVDDVENLLSGDRWCLFDDYAFVAAMREAAGGEGYLGELARMYLAREPPKMVLEVKAYLPGREGGRVVVDSVWSRLYRMWKNSSLLKFLEQEGVPVEWVFVHEPKISLVKGDTPVYIIDGSGGLRSFYEEDESIVSRLLGHVYAPLRIYARKGYEEVVSAALEKLRGA